MLLCSFCQETSCACLICAVLMSFGHVSFMLIVVPFLILKICKLGTVVPRSFISQKTALAGPLTVVDDVASHTLSFPCSSHIVIPFPSRPPVPNCTFPHLPLRARSQSCSPPKTRRARLKASFPTALARCLRISSLLDGTMPRALNPQTFPGTTPMRKTFISTCAHVRLSEYLGFY